MINFLDQNAGAIQGIATVVLVLVTGYYAVVTGRMAKSAKKTADAVAQQQMLQFIAMFRTEFQGVRAASSSLRQWAKGQQASRGPLTEGVVMGQLTRFARELDKFIGTCPEPFIRDVHDAATEARLVSGDIAAGRVSPTTGVQVARRLAGVGEIAERYLGGRDQATPHETEGNGA